MEGFNMIVPGKWEECAEFCKEIENFIKNPIGLMVFAGKNGNGKSFVAKKIYNSCVTVKLPYYDWDQAIFIKQADLNSLWFKKIAEYGNTLYFAEQISKTKLLIIDDIGTCKPTEGFMDFLYTIADKRYENRQSSGTIITSNLNAMTMREKFGDAFVSRIASGKCFRFEGCDRRINEF